MAAEIATEMGLQERHPEWLITFSEEREWNFAVI